MAYTSAQIVQAVPTGINSALVCVQAETAFTSVNTITVDGIFTSTYTNYKIVMRADCSGNQDLNLQLRVGGVTATATNYNNQRVYVDGTTNSGARSANQAHMSIGAFNGAFFGVFNIELFSPFVATPTGMTVDISDSNGAYTNPFFVLYRGNHSVSTAYDGFIATVTSGATTSGTYTIYGYGKAV